MTNTTVNFATDKNLLDGILNFFTHLCSEGVVSMIPYAEYLITVFCIIDLGMSWWLYEGELRFPALLQKILKMSAFLFIIYNWQYITGLIETSFCYIGYIASGHTSQEALDLINIEGVKQGSLFSPSTLWEKFCACIEQLSGEMNKISVFSIGRLFGLLVAYIITFFGFFFMIVQLFLTMVEFSIFTCLAVILMPFGCIQYTSFLSQRAISGTFSYGIKLMVLYFLLGCVSLISKDFGKAMADTSATNFGGPLGIGLAYLVIGYLVMKVPDLVQSMMSGTPNLGNSITAGGMAHTAMSTARGVTRGAVMGAKTAAKVTPAALSTVAAATGAGASIVKGIGENASRAAGQAKAQGGSIGAQALRTAGNFIGTEAKQALGAAEKGGGAIKNGVKNTAGKVADIAKNAGHRVAQGFENTVTNPAKNSYNAGNARRAEEIPMGQKTVDNAAEKWHDVKGKTKNWGNKIIDYAQSWYQK